MLDLGRLPGVMKRLRQGGRHPQLLIGARQQRQAGIRGDVAAVELDHGVPLGGREHQRVRRNKHGKHLDGLKISCVLLLSFLANGVFPAV
jgi:hypothetical protein